eukprot:4098441-Pyramimonas_sp.AAC.1
MGPAFAPRVAGNIGAPRVSLERRGERWPSGGGERPREVPLLLPTGGTNGVAGGASAARADAPL